MNLSAYEIALIAGGFTIIGTLLGAWITYRNALEIQKIEEFNKASAVFRATFVDEIFHIRRNVEPFFKRFGERREDIAIANEKAKIIFEVFLPNDKLSGFNAVWEQYKNPKEASKIKESPSDPEYYKKLGEIRLSHINNLLEFAKPKI